MQVDRFLFQNKERVALMECLHLDKVNINLIHLKDVILILRGYCHALESKKKSVTSRLKTASTNIYIHKQFL